MREVRDKASSAGGHTESVEWTEEVFHSEEKHIESVSTIGSVFQTHGVICILTQFFARFLFAITFITDAHLCRLHSYNQSLVVLAVDAHCRRRQSRQ